MFASLPNTLRPPSLRDANSCSMSLRERKPIDVQVVDASWVLGRNSINLKSLPLSLRDTSKPESKGWRGDQAVRPVVGRV